MESCTTCGLPANRGYVSISRDEQCCDPIHAPYLIPNTNEMRRFYRFHGKRKANFLLRKTRGSDLAA